MRGAIALLVLALPARTAEMKIDHVTVAGVHVAEMRQAFSGATGIPTEYGGPHSNHATEMALASFPDGSYIELIGIQQQDQPLAVFQLGDAAEFDVFVFGQMLGRRINLAFGHV